MADEPSAAEKTEQPSLKRREDARRKGQSRQESRSHGGGLSPRRARRVHGSGARGSSATPRRCSGMASARRPSPSWPREMPSPSSSRRCTTIAHLAWPFLVIPAAAAIAVQLLQTRFAVSWEGLKPQMSRVNPIEGTCAVPRSQGLVDGLKTMVKLGVLIYVAVGAVRGAWGALLDPGHGEGLLITVAAVVSKLWLAVALAYLVIAAVRLRAPVVGAREEPPDDEGGGAPGGQGAGRQSRAQVAPARAAPAARRAPDDAGGASAPTWSSAIPPTSRWPSLRPAAMRAPRVVAKGARLVAERIVENAAPRRARHREQAARPALYKAVPVGSEIPGDALPAVAEILAYVWSLTDGGR